MIIVNLMIKTRSSKSPNFTWLLNTPPCLQWNCQACQHLPLIIQSQPGEMHYKAPGTAEISRGLAGSQRKHSCAQELSSLAQDLAAWHRGKRLNEKQEISSSISPRVTTVVGQQQKEGWCHQTVVSGTQHPGYALGLCFDNILYFP